MSPLLAEGYIYSDSRCYSAILADQSAEPGNMDYRTLSVVQGRPRLRGLKRQPTMRTLLVVVGDVRLPHARSWTPARSTSLFRTGMLRLPGDCRGHGRMVWHIRRGGFRGRCSSCWVRAISQPVLGRLSAHPGRKQVTMGSGNDRLPVGSAGTGGNFQGV